MDEFRSVSGRLGGFSLEPSAEDLQTVRETIVRAIGAPRALQVAWLWWSAGVFAILLLLALSLQRPPKQEPQLAEAIWLPPALLPKVSFVIRRPVKPRAAALAGLKNASVEKGVLKLTTADPNVVILLPLEEGDKHEN